MRRRRGDDCLVGGYTCARTDCRFKFTEHDYEDGYCVIEQGERWCTECTPDAMNEKAKAAAGTKRKVHPRGLAATSPKRRRREEEEEEDEEEDEEEEGDEKKEEPTGVLSATEVPAPPVSAPAPATEVPVPCVIAPAPATEVPDPCVTAPAPATV